MSKISIRILFKVFDNRNIKYTFLKVFRSSSFTFTLCLGFSASWNLNSQSMFNSVYQVSTIAPSSILKIYNSCRFLINFCCKLGLGQLGFHASLSYCGGAHMRICFKLWLFLFFVDSKIVVCHSRSVVHNFNLLRSAPCSRTTESWFLLNWSSNKSSFGSDATERGSWWTTSLLLRLFDLLFCFYVFPLAVHI